MARPFLRRSSKVFACLLQGCSLSRSLQVISSGDRVNTSRRAWQYEPWIWIVLQELLKPTTTNSQLLATIFSIRKLKTNCAAHCILWSRIQSARVRPWKSEIWRPNSQLCQDNHGILEPLEAVLQAHRFSMSYWSELYLCCAWCFVCRRLYRERDGYFCHSETNTDIQQWHTISGNSNTFNSNDVTLSLLQTSMFPSG